MRQEVELNESQERKVAKIRRRALQHREQKEYFDTNKKYEPQVLKTEEKSKGVFDDVNLDQIFQLDALKNKFSEIFNKPEQKTILPSGTTEVTISTKKNTTMQEDKQDLKQEIKPVAEIPEEKQEKEPEKKESIVVPVIENKTEVDKQEAQIKTVEEAIEESKKDRSSILPFMNNKTKKEDKDDSSKKALAIPFIATLKEKLAQAKANKQNNETASTGTKASLAALNPFKKKETVQISPLSDGGNNNNNNSEKPKVKKTKQKKPKASKPVFILAIFMSIVVFMCAVAAIAALVFAYKLCEDKPTLKIEDLRSPDSTIIYDSDGNKIMELGMYLRENIEYKDMPNCLIDAFLAIEDSRFFEHHGFDIPRFTKAALANFRTRDFSQGGSTITMQLIKNSYFSIDADDESTIAARQGMSGIKRKMQEIVLALELENIKKVSKQEIISLYINKVNYGNNIRGVQKAAQYYFGKDAKNLNVSESAFLAGLINSPNTYNPYNDLYKHDNYYLDPESEYLQNAYERRDEVLDLMVNHGYISEKESELAKSIRIEDLLKGTDETFSNTNDKYQGYIDAVIDEVIEVTGESPYEVGMEIYTNMNAYMQEYIYDMQNEEEYVGLSFPNELCESAIVVLDNQNGAVEALGGGRGETEQARQFNRATSAYLNPGSSIKPVIDYALCIEELGYATSHTFTDMPYYLYGGNVLISNYDHVYYGDMMMTEALGRSQNTPAVQALAAVVDAKGEEFVVDYLNSIGFKFDYADFDLQFAIGGNRCLVTPLQLAGAHAMFINGGRYIKPHTVNYIVYNDGRENFVADTKGKQLLSPETAWMVAYLEDYNMTGSYSSLMWYCKRYLDYPLYGKTGTTDWGDSGKDVGIPTGATKDSWLLMQTNKYTISCWTGYDEMERGAYFTNAEYQENTKSKIVTKVLQELEEHHLGEYDPYVPLEKPEGVVEFTHTKGAYPYAEPGGGYESTNGYIRAKDLQEHPLVSVSEALDVARKNVKYIKGGIGNINGAYDGHNVYVTFGGGEGSSGLCSGECDLSTTNVYGDTTFASGRIWFPHWNAVYSGTAVPPFYFTVQGDTGETVTGTTDGYEFTVGMSAGSIQACVSTDPESTGACINLSAPSE